MKFRKQLQSSNTYKEIALDSRNKMNVAYVVSTHDLLFFYSEVLASRCVLYPCNIPLNRKALRRASLAFSETLWHSFRAFYLPHDLRSSTNLTTPDINFVILFRKK